jgi:hypothetical protein
MTLTLPDELLRATQLSEAELQTEFALALFRIERLATTGFPAAPR